MAAVNLQDTFMHKGKECPKRYILVMGPTGAGKSTFIDNAMSPGDPTPKVGHGLESQTAEIQEYTIGEIINNFEVILVDTPGFNDTENGDSLAFGQISGWLEQYPHPLPGVIYIYSIQTEKGTNSFVRSLEIFKKICGDPFSPNITLVTNKWSRPGTRTEHAREKELKDKDIFWAGLVGKHAKMRRYHYFDFNQEEFTSEDPIQWAATDGSENEASEGVGGEVREEISEEAGETAREMARENARENAREIIKEVLRNKLKKTRFQQQVFNEGRQAGGTSACLAVVGHLAKIGADADDEEKHMKATAEELKESDPEKSAYCHEQAEHARSQKENIQKQWTILASLVDGIGSILAAIAEKYGYPLLRDGVLSLTRAAAMHLGKEDFDPST
ncbi:hypothetical protein TWF706_007353 [Orbilia oligospora]|nr:hypothetical protein TWF706_007353 [Orbilia oligospora]